jgi:hypothetical protein
MSRRFVVYVDWTADSQPRPFYVGKGTVRRVADKTPRNPRHHAIVQAHGLRRVVAFTTMDERLAFDKERELISLLKTRHDNGYGANFTDGGEGTSGWKAPVLWRKAASERQRRRLASPDARARRRQEAKEDWVRRLAGGYQVSEATREKLRARVHPPESATTRKLKSVAQKLRWVGIRNGTRLPPILTDAVVERLGRGKEVLRKPVVQVRLGVVVDTFPSICDANLHTGVSASHISECCRGKRRSAGGFTWVFQGA